MKPLIPATLFVIAAISAPLHAEPWPDARENDRQPLSQYHRSGTRFPKGHLLYPANVSVKRSIMGAADFEKVRDLSQATDGNDIQLSRRVAHLEVADFLCSGFLVGPDLLLTNHHCVVDEEKNQPLNVATFKIYMRYLQDDDKGGVDSGVLEVLKKDRDLDYALLRLTRRLGDSYGWLELDSSANGLTGSVKVIQHPQGRSKEIARKESNVVEQKAKALHYLADTEGGSSGSPVFMMNGNSVVALHHVGVQGRFNEGILTSVIVPEIRDWLPGGAPSVGPTAGNPPNQAPNQACNGRRGTSCPPEEDHQPAPQVSSPRQDHANQSSPPLPGMQIDEVGWNSDQIPSAEGFGPATPTTSGSQDNWDNW